MSFRNCFIKTFCYAIGLVWIVGAVGCAHQGAPTPAVADQPPVRASVGPPPALSAPAVTETGSGLRDLPIGRLQVDPETTVRIVGFVSELGQIRMVPPRTVFRLRDDSGAVTVVLEERQVLTEGTRLELVGKYKEIPSPAHVDVEDAPPEACFVVERYLVLPRE